MSNDFVQVQNILDKIASTSSTNEKIRIIAEHSNNKAFQYAVRLALDPYLTFKMAGTIKDDGIQSNETPPFFQDAYGKIYGKLQDFAKLPALTNKDKQAFSDLVRSAGRAAVSVINRILNKDLRCGASVLTFRKAADYFQILPIHHPMKGIDDLNKFYAQAGNRKNICWSYKLDGTRTWAIVDGNSVLWLSSNGHELSNFHCCDAPLLAAYAEIDSTLRDGRKIVFDGEMINIQGDFSRHMSQFRRLKDMDSSGFRFRVFDCLFGLEDKRPFSHRFYFLRELLPVWKPHSTDEALCAYMTHETPESSPKKLARMAVDLGLEGIMLKTWDHVYESKRSNNWCKIKFFHSEDLQVVDKIEGTGKHAGRLGALVVQRGDVQVEVGSGFTDAEREEFWIEAPKCIEVKYQDALPSGSLRFPIFVRVRDDKAT